MNPSSIKRNDPCPCGSGQRYKQCCGMLAAPVVPVNHFSASADDAIARRQYTEAVSFLIQACTLRPNDVNLLNKLGHVRHLAGDNENAIQDFRKALAIAPDQPALLINLANVLHETNALDEAEQLFLRVIALDPGMVEAHYNLGLLLETAGHPSRALHAFEAALEGSGDICVRAYLGAGLACANLKDERSAKRHYARALGLMKIVLWRWFAWGFWRAMADGLVRRELFLSALLRFRRTWRKHTTIWPTITPAHSIILQP